MPIPINVLINLGLFLGFFVVIAVILSIGAARGYKFHSCKGEDSCCRNHNKSQPTTAEKILALIEK